MIADQFTTFSLEAMSMLAGILPCHVVPFIAICVYTNPVFASTFIKHRFDMGHGSFVRAVAFSPDGTMLAVGWGRDKEPGEIRFYSVEKGDPIATLKGHDKEVNCLAFTPDGGVLVTAGSDNKCVIWNIASRKAIGELKGHTNSIIALSISPNGKQVASSSLDKATVLWDLQRQRKIATLVADEEIEVLAHSPNGKLLAGGGADGTMRIWDVQTKKEVEKIKAHQKGVSGLAFTPNGRHIATCSDDGYLKLWETGNWLEVGTWDQGREQPMSLAISFNGRQLAVGTGGGEVMFYNISRTSRASMMTVLRTDLLLTKMGYRVHDAGVVALAFSSDRKTLATGSLDATVKIWINAPK
jgi:WD40 repeat protein